MSIFKRPIIGRFAPSPTGHLHLGSLTTAIASFCHIKALGGQWLLRMEDTDFERCQTQYSHSILKDLTRFGLYWDGDIIYQSNRQAIYNEFIHDHLRTISYACQCSRKQLNQYFLSHPKQTTALTKLHQNQNINTPPIYPRLCLHKILDKSHAGSKIRLCLPDVTTAFYDKIQGIIWDNPAKSLGDVVIKRQNGMINYILACAIDDGLQNISHIMRGLDIIPMTVAQLFIGKACLLPSADYFYHLPLLYNANGQKLSKQNLAKPIKNERPSTLLVNALRLLKQPIPDDMQDGNVNEILAFAIEHWDNTPLMHQIMLNAISDGNNNQHLS